MRKELKILSAIAFSLAGQIVFGQIKGKVEEASGEPAMGAKVEVKGAEVSTYTDEEGNFELPEAKVGDVLVVTNLDETQTEEVAASDNMVYKFIARKEEVAGKTIAAQKTQEAEQIDEIVVMGYGRVRDAKEVTGTATVVKGDDLANMPVASFDKALTGRVSGLSVSSATGQPGGLAQVRLRGITSVNGNNNPIYIIDGVRISSGNLTSDRNNSGTDPSTNILATINPNDIESYTVLKDAAATALYGADAGAGVIVITTKRGKQGKARFTVDMERGFSEKALNGPKSISPNTWNRVLTESVKNYQKYGTDQEAIDYINNILVPSGNSLPLWNGEEVPNWSELVERKYASQSSVNIGLTGGSDKLTYASSLNYFSQEGIVRTTEFDRLTGRLSVGYKATDKLTIRTDINAAYSKQNSVLNGGYFSNPLLTKYFMLPTEQAKNADGSYYLGENGRMFNGLFNSVYLLENNYTRTKTARVFANIQGEYQILDNLTYILNFAPEYINVERDEYDNPVHGDGANVKGRMENTRIRFFNWNLQNILSYSFALGDSHHFDTRIIQEAYKKDNKYLYTSNTTLGRMGLYSTDLFVKNESTAGNGYIATRVAYAANVSYDYAKKYYLDATIRREALNNFSEDNKWGTFWSVGAAYNLTNENFMQIDGLDLLKIKASYGELGNQLLYDDYNSFFLYGYDLNYNDAAGGYIAQLGYKDFTWEKVRQFDVGFESGFFNRRLNLSASYFHKKTKDLIFPKKISMTTGFNSIRVNGGDMVNKGVEVDLNGTIIKSDDHPDGFNWDMAINFTYVNNKVTSLPLGESISGINIVRKGEAVNSWYLRKWAGVNAETGEAQWYINGKNGEVTTKYDKAERSIQGSPLPKYMAGLTTNFSFKGISVSASLSGSFGHKIYDGWRLYTTSDGQFIYNYGGYEVQGDFWTPDNPNAKNPRPVLFNASKSNSSSTRYLYDGDFVRLRDITLGYTFPKDLVNDIGLTNLKIYLRGTNLWTYAFDKEVRDLDLEPEQNLNGGGSNFEQPIMKTFTMGVSIGF